LSKKSYHNPQGDPCSKCGKSILQHRVDHKPIGEPCEKCGLPLNKHRHRKYKYREREKEKPIYIGIDGEGQGKKNHRYVLLAASSEDGEKIWSVQDHSLSTRQCLNLILQLPRNAKIFSFSFGYDLTKILEDLDNESLYLLFHPELRRRKGPDAKKGLLPVKWKGYRLNLQGTKFKVSKDGKTVIIWDLFKFYQSKFVNALKDWKVGSKEDIEHMSYMKDKRAEFDKESPYAVFQYCLKECRYIGTLARLLDEAHELAELKLKTYYGAGSSGAAMLGAMGIKEKVRPTPEILIQPVAMAFSGGRFENSIIGMVEPGILVYNRDISSAYPYHTTFLPCLIHGEWHLTKKREEIESAQCALIHYGLGISPITTWGPFPFRDKDGSISFPIQSGGGWVWKDEYLAGERIFHHVQFKEAWVYQTACECRPFERIPEYYIIRLRIGKEGPGIVIKLAINSCYGKLAQSVGNAIFNSWIWAGLITSGCRAQVLHMLGLHKDWSNLLAVATDGIYTLENIQAPIPRDTGTFESMNEKGEYKPLGAWEEKKFNKGMFFARPGIYFPMNPTIEDIKEIRGRGVGKGVILENWPKIIDCWDEHGINGIAKIANVSRFCGVKTSISRSGKRGHYRYNRAKAEDGKMPCYGQWINRQVDMTFNPMPKRRKVNADGRTLQLRKFPQWMQSTPYQRSLISRESLELLAAKLELMEQPDADITDFGDDDVC